MTESTLKSVVVLDPETQGYKPAAHNLAATQAVDLVQQFSQEDRTAKVIDQEQRHRTSDPVKCRICKKAAEQASLQTEADAHDSDRDAAAS
jgi:hypothetical protein